MRQALGLLQASVSVGWVGSIVASIAAWCHAVTPIAQFSAYALTAISTGYLMYLGRLKHQRHERANNAQAKVSAAELRAAAAEAKLAKMVSDKQELLRTLGRAPSDDPRDF